MNKRDICNQVADIVCGARNETHGDSRIQLALEGKIKRLLRENNYALTEVESAALDAIVLKITRLVVGEPQDDHWRDIIGYAVIAAEERYALTAEDKAFNEVSHWKGPSGFPYKAWTPEDWLQPYGVCPT